MAKTTKAKRGRPSKAKSTTTTKAKRGRPPKRLKVGDCDGKLITSRLEGGYSLKKRVRKMKSKK